MSVNPFKAGLIAFNSGEKNHHKRKGKAKLMKRYMELYTLLDYDASKSLQLTHQSLRA